MHIQARSARCRDVRSLNTCWACSTTSVCFLLTCVMSTGRPLKVVHCRDGDAVVFSKYLRAWEENEVCCAGADGSRRAFYKEFAKVVEAADVVIQVQYAFPACRPPGAWSKDKCWGSCWLLSTYSMPHGPVPAVAAHMMGTCTGALCSAYTGVGRAGPAEQPNARRGALRTAGGGAQEDHPAAQQDRCAQTFVSFLSWF